MTGIVLDCLPNGHGDITRTLLGLFEPGDITKDVPGMSKIVP